MNAALNDSKVERIVLEMACEDYAGLYEIVWALNTSFPEVTKDEKISAASRAVDTLIKKGFIEMYEWNWQSHHQRSVPLSTYYQKANNPATWEPADVFLAFAATNQGNLTYYRINQ